MSECPFCKSFLEEGAKKCPNCHELLAKNNLGNFLKEAGVFVLPIVAIVISFQANQLSSNAYNFTKKLAEIEFRPILEIEGHSVEYKGENLTFNYYLFNSGKSSISKIERCHTLFAIDKSTNQEFEAKPEYCISNEFDTSLFSQKPSLIHQDNIGNYHFNDDESKVKYYRVNMRVNYRTEKFIGKQCSTFRSFYLIPILTDSFAIKPLPHLEPNCI